MLRDAIGRDWQCGTLQVDPNLPERLDAEYVGEDGARHRPIMLHRAIFGSFERFIGILIEQYAGRFPLWLAPGAGSGGDHRVGCRRIRRRRWPPPSLAAGLAVETDLTNQKINAKVREHSLAHVPVLAVVGRKEAETRTVALRRLGSQAQEDSPAGGGGCQTCIRGNTARSNIRQCGLILGQLFAHTTRRSIGARFRRRRRPF